MFSLAIEPNLELRHFELHHSEILFALINSSRTHLRRYLGFVDLATLITAEDFIRRSREKYIKDGSGNFGIWLGAQLVGVVSLFDVNTTHRKAEVGYWIGAPFAGRGIITKAVSSLLDYAFSELGLNRIQLCCATDNKPSQRVAEKLGFLLEGLAREDRTLRGSRVSHQVWSLLDRDRRSRAAYFSKPLGDALELRLLELNHAQSIFEAIEPSREHLRRFLPWVDLNTSPAHFKNFISSSLDQFKNFDGFSAGIWLDGGLVGIIGLHFIDWEHQDTEFGYWLAKDFTGRGIMNKAARAMLDYVFFELHLHRVSIAHALENTASKAVIERLGFKPESVTRDAEWLYARFHDWQRYGLLRRDWRG